MQKLEAGGRVYALGTAVATLSFTPLFDRAARVTNIKITNPSAADNWTVVCAGREIMRVRILTVGGQQPFGVQTQYAGSAPGNLFDSSNLFYLARRRLNTEMSIPVRNGMTLTVASVGGATANVFIEAEEVDPGDLNAQMINHDQGNEFVVPIFLYVNAAVSAIGNAVIDTQVSPPWVPNIVNNAEFPPGWRMTVLQAFLEGGGVNTFSGAANHQSTTSYLALTKNGQAMFTRSVQGIPLIGEPSAAGSANTTIATSLTPLPSIQNTLDDTGYAFDPPLTFNPGDVPLWALNIAGDVTGGASYVNFVQVLLVDLVRV